jgi:hypothetical protein
MYTNDIKYADPVNTADANRGKPSRFSLRTVAAALKYPRGVKPRMVRRIFQNVLKRSGRIALCAVCAAAGPRQRLRTQDSLKHMKVRQAGFAAKR